MIYNNNPQKRSLKPMISLKRKAELEEKARLAMREIVKALGADEVRKQAREAQLFPSSK